MLANHDLKPTGTLCNELSGASGGRPAREQAHPSAGLRVPAEMLRVCCRSILEPRLAEVRDKSGQQLYFLTVWCCPECGRVRR